MSSLDDYDPVTWFRKTLIQEPGDIDTQFGNTVPPSYDLKKLDPQEMDIDMIEVRGRPVMLNEAIDAYIEVFPKNKPPNSNMKGFVCISAEPWQLYIRKEYCRALGAVVRHHDRTYPHPRSANASQFPLNIQVHGHVLIDWLVEAGVESVRAYKYGMKDKNLGRAANMMAKFRRHDSTCKVFYDLGYSIKPSSLFPTGEHSTLVGSFDSEAARR